MANIYESGDFTVATAISAPRFSNPIRGDNTPYILQQEFMQKNASWTTTALNTAHPDFATFKLCSESDREPLDGGLVKWTRTYAKVPATHSEPSTMNYFFVGYVAGNTSQGNAEAREPFNKRVVVYMQHDYFLIGAGQTYTTIEAVPLLTEQTYTGQGGAAFPVRILGGVSIPTKDQYIESIIGTLINVEGSDISFWQGNIAVRKTPRIYAR